MQHYDDSELRRSLDEPGAVDANLVRHTAECSACRARLDAIEADARFAARLFAGEPAARAAVFVPRPARSRPQRAWIAAALAAAAAVVLALAFTPLGGVGAQLLTIFEPTQFAAIDVTARDREQLRLMPRLESFGTFARSAVPAQRSVASLAGLDEQLGFEPRTVGSVPQGTLRTYVQPAYTVAFTFSAAKARAYEQRYRRTLPPMPAGLDGTTVRVSIGPILMRVYGTSTAAPRHHRLSEGGIAFFEMKAPHMTSTGAPEPALAAYLLSLPNVPPGVAAELRAIDDPAHTIPVPLPIDKMSASGVTIDDVHGLAVGDQTGLGSGVMWQKDGMVYAVAGSAKESEILDLAGAFK